MKDTTCNKNLTYRVKYIYNTDFYVKCMTDVREINVENFNAEIPEDFIGYMIICMSGVRNWNSYSVYKGNVISYKEAKEKFSDKEFFSEITDELMLECKTTEELNKQFSKPVNLRKKFEEFVQECEANGLPDPIARKIGVVVTEKKQPYHLWSTDVIIPLEEN